MWASFRPCPAASFNLFLGEGRLMASRCTACAAVHLPPRAICPKCFGEALEWIETSGRGTLVAYTAIAIGPAAMQAEQLPQCAVVGSVGLSARST